MTDFQAGLRTAGWVALFVALYLLDEYLTGKKSSVADVGMSLALVALFRTYKR